jgi:hypothetical protein
MGVSTLALALVAVNLLTLNRDTAALRSAMFAATGAQAKMAVQLDLGPAWFQAVRSVIAFVPQVPPEARLALKSVKNACVGVYQLPHNTKVRDAAALMDLADEEMAKRGWSRAVGVNQKEQTVLLYTPTAATDSDVLRVCIAVCDGKQIVVVSTEIEAGPLQQLMEQTGGFKGGKLALR